MAGASTRRALCRRAIQTAKWLEHWAQRLHDEMKKQNIELMPRQDLRSLAGDNNMTIALTRRDVRALIVGMHEQINEIRRFVE